MNNYTKQTTNIFFPDQKEPVYDPRSEYLMSEFKDYWRKEKDRCMNGFWIANEQIKIPGRLYFHCVYGKIRAYIEKKIGTKIKKIPELITPTFRDIDWDIFNDLEDCDEQGKFYMLVGSRNYGKSVIGASCVAHNYTFYKRSESIVSAGASSYIKLAWDKVEDTLLNLHPVLKKQRLKSDWKTEISAGYKEKTTGLPDSRSSFSSIKNINYENGNKSMAAVGTRPGFHLIDEIGTIPYLISCVKDSDGCWWAGAGESGKPSCLVFLSGTGGDMEKGKEAAEMFFRPEAYNMLAFDHPREVNGKMGRFISALRAKMDFKESWTFFDYLTKICNVDLQPHPDLERIKILVSNEERALKEWWEPEYAKALKSGNPKTVLKFKAYWPVEPEDCFIVLSQNDFNVEQAKIQKTKLEYNNPTPTCIKIHNDNGRLYHEILKGVLPITEFPVKTQSKDAPIVMWEPPVPNPPFGLYIAAADPFTQEESESSDSLGAVYIFKRIHSLTSELQQHVFVASYVARPNSQTKWFETARDLIKYYNARCLVENDQPAFINWMVNKGEEKYLEPTPDWLKTVQASSSTYSRKYGISMAPAKIRELAFASLKNYLDDPISIEKDEEGNVIRQVLGVQRIPDPMLLEEIIKFNKTGNFDRIIAACLCILLADKMDPTVGRVQEYDQRIEGFFKGSRQSASLFNKTRTVFKQKRKLFR